VKQRPGEGFTLVELLIAMSIVAVLASLLVMASSKVVNGANSAKSSNNLRQLFLVARNFSLDNNDFLPPITGLFPEKYNGMGYTGILDEYGAKKVKVDPSAPSLRLFGYGMNMNLCPALLEYPINGQDPEAWGKRDERFWYNSCYKWAQIDRPSKVVLYTATAGRTKDAEMAWYLSDYWTVVATNGAIQADRIRPGFIQAVACDGHVEFIPEEELARPSPRSEWWTNGPPGFIPN